MAIERKRIVCVGMMTCDSYYYDVDMDLLSKSAGTNTRVLMTAGGDATNVAIDLAHMGHEASLIGMIGTDFSGDGHLKTVQAAGVDTSNVIRREDVDTTMTLILYTKDAKDASDRHLSRNEGGNALISESDITDDMLRGASHLHYGSFGPLKSMDGEDGAKLLKRAKALGLSTSLDIKGVGRDFEKLKVMLPYVDLFIPNMEEVEDLTGLTDLEEIKELFRELGVGTLCVKMAEKGVFITDYEEEMILPTLAKPDEIVEVMGAGDAFCAGFITAHLAGMTLKECGTYASLASKHCLATRGASVWQVSCDELERQMREVLGK